ncbi:MAG TPA: efflux RND transporter periplasmic adaptor subunit [Pirellulales bacterium]|nr:efflux RND transporter periplasmic adaptor subunit [Pirellulales bacterium]
MHRPALGAFKKTGEFELARAQAPAIVTRSHADLVKSKAPSGRRLSKTAVAVASALVAAVTAIGAYQPWKSLPSDEAVAASEAGSAARTVNVDRPTPAVATSVVLPATFRPWQTTTLHARVSGYLKAWHQDLGAVVKAGEVLAEIETPEVDQQLVEGEALAREAAAAAVQAKAERVEAEADLKVAEALLLRIQADAELVRSQLVRREKLLTTRAIAQEEYDTFLKQTEARVADVAAAKADVARRRANLATRAAIIEVREATANSRQANVARLQELQTFKRIVAPFGGVVMRRTAEVGMLVTAGQDSLFVIEDTSRVRVQINVPQTYSLQTKPGVAAVISVPEAALQDLPATITRIAESVDAASRTMLAEIEVENASHQLQPGSYAQVTLSMPQAGGQWTIPTNAVSMRVEGPHVAVVGERNQIELKRVSLGRDLGARVIVLDGIRGDERLVVNPSDDLVDGVSVRIGPRDLPGEIARR